MKTQVIHLDLHDDIISIRDRMTWAKTPRILLVWPRHGRIDMRPLDLTLLRRHAEALGAELGLVTRNGEIRSAAREAGISIFSSSADAQKKQWLEKLSARPVRRFPRADLRSARSALPRVELFTLTANPLNRVLIFVAGVLAVLVVMLVFIPSAEIHVTPPVQKQSLTIAVSADPLSQNVQLSGIIPQRVLTLALEGSDSALPTGKIILPDQFANGEVVLMNLSNKSVNVPSGTVLLAPANPDIAFVTAADTDVPAGKGKTAKTAIRAQTAGEIGNLIPGAITSFEGPLGLSLAVTNPSPTQGGTEHEASISTETDRTYLKKRLLSDLEQRARERFASQISSGDVLLPASLSLTHMTDEAFTPPAGQAGEKLSLKVHAEYSMAYASFADLHLLAERVLNASLASGFVSLPGAIDIAPASLPVNEKDIAHWQMRVTRSIRPYLDSGQVISIVLGKTARQAGSLLSDAYGLTHNPEISIHPGWWPWLPFLPIRISVTG